MNRTKISDEARVLAGWTDPDERAQKIQEALIDARIETTRTLASALRKFAPDLTSQIVERHEAAETVFDDLLALLRAGSSVSAAGESDG